MDALKPSKKNSRQILEPVGADFFDRLWEESWIYIKTVVDVVSEPVLILDKDLKVMAANESYYKTFQTTSNETEHKIVYELGTGEWNIPALRKLLSDILPNNVFFKGFEVTRDFPGIGRKSMILNARQVHFEKDTSFQPIILLAMDDITEMMDTAETFSDYANQSEIKLTERTGKLETLVIKLEKEINELKKGA